MTEDNTDPIPSRRKRKGTKRGDKRALVVEDSGLARPYMRGIMIHSLMARGIAFDEAYETSQQVADRLRDRPTVDREELGVMAREILGEAFVTGKPIPIPINVVGDRGKGSFSKGTLSPEKDLKGNAFRNCQSQKYISRETK